MADFYIDSINQLEKDKKKKENLADTQQIEEQARQEQPNIPEFQNPRVPPDSQFRNYVF